MLTVEQKMLNMVDIDLLDAIARKYNVEGLESFDMQQYLHAWVRNKKDLFVMFGEKLRIEQEVEYTIDHNIEESRKMIANFVARELSDNPEYSLVKLLISNLSPTEIKNNILNRNINILGIQLKTGERISKSIAKLAFTSDKKGKEDLQTKYSMLVQDFSAKGIAALSIDPVDYLTMSVNESGWTSCHSLDGCYRTGTLSYLQDKATCISYVKSRADGSVEVKGETKYFSNKNWRQIVSFSRDRDYAIQARQYPNTNRANQSTIAKIIGDILKTKTGNEYHDVEADVRGSVISRLHPSYYGSSFFYNDIECGAFSTAYIVVSEDIESVGALYSKDPENKCLIGWTVECICGCGYELSDSDRVSCYSCRNNCEEEDEY